MHEGFVEELGIGAELRKVGADVAVGDFRRLLHHLAQLPGQFETAVQGMDARRLDRQGRATHAGPGQPGNHAFARQHLLAAEYRHPQGSFKILGHQFDRHIGFVDQLHDCLAHQFAQLFLQLAHAGLAGIALDDGAQGAVADGQAILVDTGLGQLLGPQVTLGDRHFLFGDVAGQADHFHAVEQRAGDGIQGVGGAHEEHLGQVQAQIQVVVEEVDVLLRVQGFQQCRRRVALEALAHLVDFVEHDHRVHHLDVLERLHQLARLGTDVGAAVALDFGLVAHAADAEAIERSAQGLGDGLADAGLAHARRTDQQHDGTADFTFVGAHGKEFDDARLDVIQTGVVLVEHLACMLEIQLVLAVDTPWQGSGPVQIVACDGVLGRTGFQNRQFLHFLVDALLRRGRQGLVLQALLELLDVGTAIVLGQAQLLLDDLELFLEEELALVLADLLVHLGGDFFLQTRDFDFLAQHRQDFFHASQHRHAVEHALQLVARGRGERGGEVGQRRWIVGAETVEVVLQLFAVQRVERQQLLDGVDQRHAVGLDLVGGLDGLLRVFDFHQIGRTVMLEPGADAHARQTLRDELQLAVFAAGVVDLHQGAVQRQAGGIEMAVVVGRGVHEEQRQRVVFGVGDQVEGFRPRLFVDDDRQHLRGEERAVVDRDDVDLVRQVLPRQGQFGAGVGRVLDVLVVQMFGGILVGFLLVAHGAPASMTMLLRWGGGRLVSMAALKLCGRRPIRVVTGLVTGAGRTRRQATFPFVR